MIKIMAIVGMVLVAMDSVAYAVVETTPALFSNHLWLWWFSGIGWTVGAILACFKLKEV